MRRSPLETYVEIISLLSQEGPLRMTNIMYKANITSCMIKKVLDFLVKQNLVEERIVGRTGIDFAVTQRGINVLKYFQEPKQMSPIVEA
jgi:predicted transcriptional regulator